MTIVEIFRWHFFEFRQQLWQKKNEHIIDLYKFWESFGIFTAKINVDTVGLHVEKQGRNNYSQTWRISGSPVLGVQPPARFDLILQVKHGTTTGIISSHQLILCANKCSSSFQLQFTKIWHLLWSPCKKKRCSCWVLGFGKVGNTHTIYIMGPTNDQCHLPQNIRAREGIINHHCPLIWPCLLWSYFQGVWHWEGTLRWKCWRWVHS